MQSLQNTTLADTLRPFNSVYGVVVKSLTVGLQPPEWAVLAGDGKPSADHYSSLGHDDVEPDLHSTRVHTKRPQI